MLIEAVRRVEAAAREMLAAVNGGTMSCAEAREVLAACKSAVAVMSAAQTTAARVVAGVERHGDGGVQALADAAGMSRRDAHSQVKTAKTIEAAPAVRDAVEEGRVSSANAKRLAEVIEKTSAEAVESDGELLAKAESMRPEQFTREARRWATDRQGDGGEADYRRLRAKRCLRIWDTDDGMVRLHGPARPRRPHLAPARHQPRSRPCAAAVASQHRRRPRTTDPVPARHRPSSRPAPQHAVRTCNGAGRVARSRGHTQRDSDRAGPTSAGCVCRLAFVKNRRRTQVAQPSSTRSPALACGLLVLQCRT